MDISYKDNKGRNRLARGINSLNRRYPFTIPWLYNSCSANRIRAYNHFRYYNYAHYKSYLAKIVAIVIKDAVWLTRLLNALKPRVNCVWILTFSAL